MKRSKCFASGIVRGFATKRSWWTWLLLLRVGDRIDKYVKISEKLDHPFFIQVYTKYYKLVWIKTKIRHCEQDYTFNSETKEVTFHNGFYIIWWIYLDLYKCYIRNLWSYKEIFFVSTKGPKVQVFWTYLLIQAMNEVSKWVSLYK